MDWHYYCAADAVVEADDVFAADVACDASATRRFRQDVQANVVADVSNAANDHRQQHDCADCDDDVAAAVVAVAKQSNGLGIVRV